MRVGLADLERGEETLRAAGFGVRRDTAQLLVDGVDEPARLTEVLAGRGLFVSELTLVHADLETVFLALTGSDDAARANH